MADWTTYDPWSGTDSTGASTLNNSGVDTSTTTPTYSDPTQWSGYIDPWTATGGEVGVPGSGSAASTSDPFSAAWSNNTSPSNSTTGVENNANSWMSGVTADQLTAAGYTSAEVTQLMAAGNSNTNIGSTTDNSSGLSTFMGSVGKFLTGGSGSSGGSSATGLLGSLGTFLSSSGLGSSVASAAEAALPLALAQAFMGGQKDPAALSGLQANQQTYNSIGSSLMSNWQSGKVSPGQQAELNKYKTDETAAARQYMISSGQGVDSSSMLQLQQGIDQGAELMKQGFVDKMFAEGMQAMGASDNISTTLIDLEMKQSQQKADVLKSFMTTYGMIMGKTQATVPVGSGTGSNP